MTRTSTPVGPLLTPILSLFNGSFHIGASVCTNDKGTNSVNPFVSACTSLRSAKCAATCRGVSTHPYMAVLVEEKVVVTCVVQCTVYVICRINIHAYNNTQE